MEKIESARRCPPPREPEFARKAESLGYDYLGAGTHDVPRVRLPTHSISLSVAAGATTKIKLMSTVVLRPLMTTRPRWRS